ncbi:MAG: hypothetical protein CM15mP128_1310 [Methanobacteriota archaeon]|nr:MAG: hypothetical protein CM15mP128_1310 [Euryarchaeota archaeon]
MDWAEMNGCEGIGGLPKDLESYADYSVMGYDACEMDTEVQLVTLNYANHWPYPASILTTRPTWIRSKSLGFHEPLLKSDDLNVE